MKHFDDGTLRRMVDDPAALTDSRRRHYDGCATCQERFMSVSTDARETQALFSAAVPAISIDTTVALAAVRGRLATAPNGRQASTYSRRRAGAYRRWLQVPAAALIASAAVLASFAWTPAGSWAQDFIAIFQPTQVVGIQTTTADLQNLQSLSNYGTFKGPTHTSYKPATSAAVAAGVTGFAVVRPGALPASVTASPSFKVLLTASASFTFSTAKARAAALASGHPAPSMPANIDGSTLDVTIGPAVLTEYSAQGHIPQLIVGQMRAPVVRSSGVSVRELENYVLSLPGVSPELRAQIEAINDPAGTLPIPIPVDRASSHPVTVQGVQGLEVGDNTGLGSGIVWQKDGMIYGVAAPLSEAQVLAVANSLQQ